MSQNTEIFKRPCSKCNTIITYKNKRCYLTAVKCSTVCKSCAITKSHADNPTRFAGTNNPMSGTSAKAKWKSSMSDTEYGERIKKHKQLLSNNNSGAGNPMFGKPAPLKSGRGRSGSWQGLHFRSLLELAFLEWYYTTFNKLPKSAETKKFKCILDSGHNYFPDYVGSTGEIYEIKPSRLLVNNLTKLEAGSKTFGEKFIVKTEKDLPNYKDIHKRLDTFKNLKMNKRN